MTDNANDTMALANRIAGERDMLTRGLAPRCDFEIELKPAERDLIVEALRSYAVRASMSALLSENEGWQHDQR